MASYKYDPSQLKTFQSNVSIGMTKENAAVLAFDIGRATFYKWMKEDGVLSKKQKRDVKRAISKGRAKINQRLVLLIQKAADDGDGRLAMDLMKRLERKKYGDTTKLVGDPDEPIRHVITDEQLKRVIED